MKKIDKPNTINIISVIMNSQTPASKTPVETSVTETPVAEPLVETPVAEPSASKTPDSETPAPASVPASTPAAVPAPAPALDIVFVSESTPKFETPPDWVSPFAGPAPAPASKKSSKWVSPFAGPTGSKKNKESKSCKPCKITCQCGCHNDKKFKRCFSCKRSLHDYCVFGLECYHKDEEPEKSPRRNRRCTLKCKHQHIELPKACQCGHEIKERDTDHLKCESCERYLYSFCSWGNGCRNKANPRRCSRQHKDV